ncbi:MAG: T9SS type A sorting domain-containing protein [Bacteroidota bacterium]
MKINRINITFCLCFIFSSFYSQTIIRSTIGAIGGSLSNDKMVIQQTVGQPSAISYVQKEDGTAFRQGFHQPHISYRSETNELNALIFPNPNNGLFSFKAEDSSNAPLSYELFDQNGKIILTGIGKSNELVPVEIPNPSSGIYHLILSQESKTTSFKISVNH